MHTFSPQRQTDSIAHPAFYPLNTEAHSKGIERQGREAGHSPSSSAEVKKRGAIPPLHSAYIVQEVCANL
jgi:hypothetical protein